MVAPLTRGVVAMKEETLSIVIVTYNSKDLIDRCLAPIFRGGRAGLEVVVWDNCSSDGTVDHVRLSYPDVKVIASRDNLGFARGNNAAFDYCCGDVIVLLNPDAFIGDVEDLVAMAAYLRDHPAVGAVGPRLINADGTHQVGDAGWRPSMGAVIGHYLFLHRLLAWVPALYLTNRALLSRPETDVDWICGACLVTRRDVLDAVGGLDGEIFMYGEDVEWGERCRDRGYRVVYLPGRAVLHLQGGTQRSETETFVSTKALDALALQMSRQCSPLRFRLFRRVLQTGLLIRAGLYWLVGTVRHQPLTIARARTMRHYAAHAGHLARSVHL
jgi:GT2 family glycosyltransferase